MYNAIEKGLIIKLYSAMQYKVQDAKVEISTFNISTNQWGYSYK